MVNKRGTNLSQVLSVVAPVHNEAPVLEAFHQRLSAVMVATGYDYEIIYVDDGSEDQSAELICGLRQRDGRVSLLELSRNFGKEVALSAGLDHARGDAVILIDSDLQDPPELIQKFVDEWQAGYDVVYGRRSELQVPALIAARYQ